jgi:hypothetical protein
VQEHVKFKPQFIILQVNEIPPKIIKLPMNRDKKNLATKVLPKCAKLPRRQNKLSIRVLILPVPVWI